MGRAADSARRARVALRFLLSLRALPWRVAWFQWRSRRLALRLGDDFSLASATRPDKLAVLLAEARGRRRVVELGTATAWTSLSLVLDDPQREVLSYDPVPRGERDHYRRLAGTGASQRLTLVQAAGDAGPVDPRPVEMLYIDSSHSREGTLSEFAVWRPALADGAVVVFDDYGHPHYPGVRAAVQELGLGGEELAGLFVHRLPRADG